MKATITLQPAEVYEIIRNHLMANTDLRIQAAVAQVSCERDELPTFEGISCVVELPLRKIG
jgi:hypothetical protein